MCPLLPLFRNLVDIYFYFKSFLPYSAYSSAYSQPQQQPNAQAPLVPTGFIQGEQGTLIPVYQPEALDHYMTTGTHPTPGLPPQPQTQNSSAWRQFPFIPIPPMTSQTPTHSGNLGWMPNQPPLVFSGQQPSASAFRGGHRVGQPGQHHAPPRRHRQSTYDRNIPTRSPHTRYALGGMNNIEHTFNNDRSMPEPGRPNIFTPQLAFSSMTGAGGWNQWTGSR